MTPREPDLSQASSLPDYVAATKLYAKNGPAFTGFIGSVPIVVAGIMIAWPGLGTGWAFTTDLVAKVPCAFHRAAKRKIEEIARDKKLHRIQMEMPASHHASYRWAEHLGFFHEGTMRCYGPTGETWFRFARLF